MPMPNFKTCVVPMCRSTTIKTPEKLFMSVPGNPKQRKKWLQLAGADPYLECYSYTALFFCEDHFDLPNDIQNYIPLLRSRCLPSKFECQPAGIKRTAPLEPQPDARKLARTEVIPVIHSQESETPETLGTTVNRDFHSLSQKNLSIRTPEFTVHTVHSIKNNPKYYIGIQNECYFLILIMQKHTTLSYDHILLCLKKIRLNTPFCELADQFGISQATARAIFMESVPLISSVLHPFVIKPYKTILVLNLPLWLRNKYSNIDCIIDCLEISLFQDSQKPSRSVEQALTWSVDKKAHTAKYLIGSTPDGIISYVSPGYCGRTTDVSLLQDSDFLNYLKPGAFILAGRGFKHLEEYLVEKEINVVRPPSDSLESFRIRIERVIGRLREFSMLNTHCVVDEELLECLDHCVIIACGLINLQDSIIKYTS